jgi:hypothetical protein
MRSGGVSELVEAARVWITKVHPHARHLERTLYWLLVLDPDAGESTRIAAVTHDAERAFPDPDPPYDSARDWDVRDYNRWHQDRCADFVSRWLREQDAPSALVADVDALVRVHEWGGWPEADLLQAADSLSFLETMTPVVVGWLERGVSREHAEGKLRHSLERIAPGLPRARELAQPLLAAALAELEAADARAA